MDVRELDFDLPPERIATRPADPRDTSKLLVCSRTDPSLLEHRRFRDLPEYLSAGDLLVSNRSAVVPARLLGQRADTGGKVEGLFVAEIERGLWRCLLKSNGTLRAEQQLRLGTSDQSVLATLERRDEEAWLVRIDTDRSAAEVLERIGSTPLPPYILGRRRELDETPRDAEDRAWYQAVYADRLAPGSVAAPTAGLHFTPQLLDRLSASGIRHEQLVLHVGMGTFKPVTASTLEEHTMHREWFEVPAHTSEAIRAARAQRRAIVAVGTTTARALESLPPDLPSTAHSSEADLLIAPGHRFRHLDALITNFHLPRSTLLALVGALFDGGVPRVLELYREAIAHEYRFFSYGDAMLVLP